MNRGTPKSAERGLDATDKTAGQSVNGSSTDAGKTRILIIDDHHLVRHGLKALLAPHPDLEICGEADQVETGLAKCQELAPDLVIADLNLGSISGLDMIKHLKSINEGRPILVLTMHDEALFAERCLRAGAAGFVGKDEANERVIEAIRTVSAGQTYVSPETSAAMIHTSVGQKPRTDASLNQLTDREIEVFSLIGHGRTSREIAEQLGLSIKTIDSYRENIKQKLSLASAAELMRHAVRWVLENG